MTPPINFIGAFLVAMAVVTIVVPDSPYNSKITHVMSITLLTVGFGLVMV